MYPVIKTTINSVVAKSLNIFESAIVEVQEWATVLWVRFKGGCRFISKKIVEVKKMTGINQDKVNEFASWMQQIDIDTDNPKESGKWFVFDCDTESSYPRDIRNYVQNAKDAGFACFAKNNQCGVLIESVSY